MSTLILASASGIRARLLREAGVRFGVRPAQIDEEELSRTFLSEKKPVEELADVLAAAKAVSVSKASPDMIVLGCDQVLVCEGVAFSKAHDIAGARATLCSLRGKAHTLVSACALAREGQPVWNHQERATLWMRPFSDDFLDAYLKDEGRSILGSVGCYQFESRGAQLFDRVKGDYFTILGLPLLSILGALREQDILPQ
jgi:septum formation protein